MSPRFAEQDGRVAPDRLLKAMVWHSPFEQCSAAESKEAKFLDFLAPAARWSDCDWLGSADSKRWLAAPDSWCPAYLPPALCQNLSCEPQDHRRACRSLHCRRRVEEGRLPALC